MSELSAPPHSVSQRLDFTIKLASGPLTRLYDRFWNHPRLEHLLRAYYPHLYGFATASVDLFAAARDRAREMANTCPVAERLVRYLARHVREEIRHPNWLLQDMEVLGVESTAAQDTVPFTETAILIGTLYYRIFHCHPVSVLSYILLVEGYPPSAAVLDEVVAAGAAPRRALRAFYRHADIDERHGAEVRALLDELPLSSGHQQLLSTTAITSVGHLTSFMQQVLRLVPASQ